jgi:hypothetical protein
LSPQSGTKINFEAPILISSNGFNSAVFRTGFHLASPEPYTPNRKNGEITELLNSLGCNRIEGMARIATDEKHSRELRGRMFAELAQYVYPKRKAVELAADPVTPQQSKLVVEFVGARPDERRRKRSQPAQALTPGYRATYND